MRAFALLFLCACSTRIEYDYPCLRTSDCPESFSCRFFTCIRNGVVPEGDVCSDAVQCNAGLVCPAAAPVCTKPCNAPWSKTNDCGVPSHTCIPTPSKDIPGHFVSPYCVAQECHNDERCRTSDGMFVPAGPGNVCVQGICQVGCYIGVGDTCPEGTHCGTLDSGDRLCVPIGDAGWGQACENFPVGAGQTGCIVGLVCTAQNFGGPLCE